MRSPALITKSVSEKLINNTFRLAPIVGVDGTWRVEHGDAMLQGQSAAWSHLSLVACRQRDAQSRGDEPDVPGDAA